MIDEAASYIWPFGEDGRSERQHENGRIGRFTFRYEGLWKVVGRLPRAALMVVHVARGGVMSG